MKFVLNQPSKCWREAFPIGNGHMGAMFHGSLPINLIELTHNTFFSGEKSNYNNQKNAAKAFYEMRELAKKGEYDKVHKKAEEFIGVRHNYGTNLPVGHLKIDYGFSSDEISEYERSIDFMGGVATCSFVKEGRRFREEVFLSHPDHILVDHIRLDGKSKVSISFLPGNDYGKVYYQDNEINFTCHAYEKLHCEDLTGVMAVGAVSMITDGCYEASVEGITIRDAKDIKLYLYMSTDFNSDGYWNSITDSVEELLKKKVREHILESQRKNYSWMKLRHKKDINKWMSRVKLSIEGVDEFIPELLLMFQYGRYLLLSSSREDSLLPAHLQGIWNDNVACRTGWTCDMHLDINTQMNYWPAELTNLSEVSKPLFRWISTELASAGTNTAKESYGLNGWVAELVSNAWGFAAPYWATPIAPCPTGGIWVMMQMWEHYLYTKDSKFLKKLLFPLVEEATVFFNQYIFLDEVTGYYMSGPSISPENSFIYKGKTYQISNGCTYESIMIRELFHVFMEASKILGKFTQLYHQVCEKSERLLPYRITEHGTIAEWAHDLTQADVQHRHTSHLLGLYPFSQISPEETPLLCEAAENTLQAKLNPIDNWEDTGWARSMLMLYEARLYHGNHAYEHIKSMLSNLLGPNHMVFHPPTRGTYTFDHVYELDGNTGLTTCIGEMLLQSHKNVIRLLPALPSAWESGEVSGLCARGNITVDIKWRNGRLSSARFISRNETVCTVVYSAMKWEVKLAVNDPYLLEYEERYDI